MDTRSKEKGITEDLWTRRKSHSPAGYGVRGQKPLALFLFNVLSKVKDLLRISML